MKYTYNSRFYAHMGILKMQRIVVIPDQVADDQKAFDGKTFPAFDLAGNKIRVKLIGDDYGLFSTGTGDVVVRRA